MMKKVLFSWSGGKDSALAFYEILKTGNFEVCALLTTVTEDYGRISMHGVRKDLLEQQTLSLGYFLEKILVPKRSSNKKYESRMQAVLERYLSLGVSHVAFGDIFLEDVKKYRDKKLSKLGINGIYPLWGRNTAELAQRFLDHGFKATVTCVDGRILEREFVGKQFDENFLSELPSTVDPCGENGEFHTFVYAGPIFQEPIRYTLGNIVLRNKRFFYCDLIPIQS